MDPFSNQIIWWYFVGKSLLLPDVQMEEMIIKVFYIDKQQCFLLLFVCIWRDILQMFLTLSWCVGLMIATLSYCLLSNASNASKRPWKSNEVTSIKNTTRQDKQDKNTDKEYGYACVCVCACQNQMGKYWNLAYCLTLMGVYHLDCGGGW